MSPTPSPLVLAREGRTRRGGPANSWGSQALLTSGRDAEVDPCEEPRPTDRAGRQNWLSAPLRQDGFAGLHPPTALGDDAAAADVPECRTRPPGRSPRDSREGCTSRAEGA